MSEKGGQRLRFWERLAGGVSYPAQLPVAQRAPQLVEALKKYPVTIIAGETGSGKTTQVPKCCVEAGLGKTGRILLTQPRRLAAVRTAARLAEEWGVKVGEEVGYRIRFDHRSHNDAVVEVVTDGIPVSGDLSKSPFKGCDIVIVDEVHERSVNIDLLLGLLKQERVKNPELRVALMSATLDLERYQAFFPEAEVVEVEGRTFPVDVEYRPLENRENLGDALARTLEDSMASTSGDVLVFLPTERDIRENEDRLRSRLGGNVEVLPLFSRLPAAQQDRVFRGGGRRKIILSTNIAETSLTLPGVRVVIDSGLARVLRYQPGRGVPLLEVEWVSKASARQRTGRAGRVAPGRCIRLYEERTHLGMEDFTTPEIRRQDLAAVLLKLVSMGVHRPETFPFPDAPSLKAIRSGCRHLEFLGAVIGHGEQWSLTALGRRMVSLPVSPRLAHLLLGGRKRKLLGDVSTIAAFLSIADPRQSPADQLAKARDAHRKFAVEGSDFLSMLNLYGTYRKKREELSGQKLRRWCDGSFISWKRMKEWDQLREELFSMVGGKKDESKKRASEEDLHRVLLASHLDCLLERDTRTKDGSYRSLERVGVFAHPSSVLSKSKVDWAFCASFLNTSRLFSLHVAALDPKWLLEEAKEFLKVTRGEARFEPKVGAVVSEERFAFRSHQIHVVPSRDHFDHDPKEATEVFIREALIRGAWEHPCLKGSREVIEHLLQFDGALRIRSHLHNEDRIVEAWTKRLGECSRVHDYIKRPLEETELRLDELLGKEEDSLLEGLSLHLEIEGVSYGITYEYAPKQDRDGATVSLDLDGLSLMTQVKLESSVPKYLEERYRLGWEALPKAFRKRFEADSFKNEVEKLWHRYGGTLLETFERWFGALSSSPKAKADWLARIEISKEGHLTPKFVVVDSKGNTGDRQSSVEQAQVHSKGALARRHERQWLKRFSENLQLDANDPWENLDGARRALLGWPEEGKEAKGLDGETLCYWPRLEKTKKGWRLNPMANRERAWQLSLLSLSRILGEGEEVIQPDPELLDRVHRSGESVAEILDFLGGVARGSLWLRLRYQDLQTLEGVRSRLRKVRDRYLEKDVRRHLNWIVSSLELMGLSRRCPLGEPGALWVQEWCARLMGLRKDVGSWLALDHSRYERELKQARTLARIWIHRPHEGDEVIRLWKDIEKNYGVWRNHPLVQLRGEPSTYWEEALLGENKDFHLEMIQEATETLKKWREDLVKLEDRCSRSEEWLLDASLELEGEKHPKTRNRKKKAYEELLACQSNSKESEEGLLIFLDMADETREQWGRWGGSRERILEEEKAVEKDKLSSVLSKAWGAKRTK